MERTVTPADVLQENTAASTQMVGETRLVSVYET